MSFASADEPKHEIVIVRRGNHDEDEGHHGGVWKIAFADFMTAMMCFFLVMWLINAANEQTKAAVASYFNPVKLVDRNSSRKGIEELGEGPNASGATADSPAEPRVEGGSKGTSAQSDLEKDEGKTAHNEAHSDTQMFQDPYAVLAEIADETGTMQNISSKGEGGAQTSGPATGASGGESYRDPFAPDFWSQKVGGNDTAEGGEASAQTSADAPSAAPADTAPLEKLASDAPPAVDTKPATDARPVEVKVEAHAPSPEAIEAAREIKQEINAVFEPGEKLADGISVVATDQGVTISVTDQLDFGMFEIGSALPRREMVLAMEKIGSILKGRKGELTISGHTDGRPFRNAAYDNWRLSTARAHSAYYMLVRAGLDERRVSEVAGFADRKLKDKADAFSAANRRIEILLRVGS